MVILFVGSHYEEVRANHESGRRYSIARRPWQERTVSAFFVFLIGVAAAGATQAAGADYPKSSTGQIRSGVSIPTFQQFLDAAIQLSDGTYVVDGDIRLLNEADLYDFYVDSIVGLRWDNRSGTDLIVKLKSSGGDAVWSASQKLNLTYCISENFNFTNHQGSFFLHGAVRNAMENAAESWEGKAHVDFSHVPVEDEGCATSTNVLFRVLPYFPVGINDTLLAMSFFPDFPPADRILQINVSKIPNPGAGLSLSGLLRHELGHSLGFAHEHIRPESNNFATCKEGTGWRALTAYDNTSVMHYRRQCNGISADYFLSTLDVDGAQQIYGVPPTPPPPNKAPKAIIGSPEYQTTRHTPISIDGTGSFDPEGSSLTYKWNFGDGTAQVTSAGLVSHAYDIAGTYSVTLRVNDGLLDSPQVSTSVKVRDISWLVPVVRLVLF